MLSTFKAKDFLEHCSLILGRKANERRTRLVKQKKRINPVVREDIRGELSAVSFYLIYSEISSKTENP